jgi:outer membrane protein assembly factor BamB
MRSTNFALIAFSLFLCLSPASAESPNAEPPNDEWPQFGGSAGNYTFRNPIASDAHTPTKRWQTTLGEGMAGVVLKEGVVFTSFLVPYSNDDAKKPESERTHREAIVALDAENGKALWRHEYDAGWIESQQAFGGRSRAPQATPAVIGNRLTCIGFTGMMHCLDRKSGDVIWKKNAVEVFDSAPVQFGFSASPLPVGDKIIVLCGGKKGSTRGGLVCLDANNGDLVWNVPCDEASYATPVLWNRPDGEQIVFVTRNRIVGVAANDGKMLWDYRLSGEGMTNVPTPLPIDDSGLLVSGQGIKGTQRINVVKSDDGFKVDEAWESNEQFFYCNWVRRGNVLWGNDGNLLMTIDLITGKTIGRFRGFNDANLLLAGDQLLVFHGDGHLSELHLTSDGATVKATFSVLDERCWTPPTPSERYLYCRGGDQLLCLDLVGGDEGAAVATTRIRKPALKFQTNDSRKTAESEQTPTQRILAAFNENGSDGPKAAWRTYNQLRNEDPDSISFQQRQKLAEMANGEGLHDFAKLILQHAAEDFPELAAEASRTPSNEVTRSENGLVYLELAVRNPTEETIQAYVKGPSKHPFSYGLPIRAGQSRVEKWPVGTQLFRTVEGIRKDVLLTVKEEFSGKTIDVAQSQGESEDGQQD